MSSLRGIWDQRIPETPVAVLDFETTGLYPGSDRVVEISVVRCDPDGRRTLVIDTLVNPNRKMGATDVHGLTDADVADAPRFEEVAGHLLRALSGCVLATYNVSFDVGFLKAELRRLGVGHLPPHLCLMYLQPMLGLGKRGRLDELCAAHGVAHHQAHTTAADATAAAHLWDRYRAVLADRRIQTFRELAAVKSYKFVDSFDLDPLAGALAAGLATRPTRPRQPTPAPVVPAAIDKRRVYWEALKTAVTDLTVSDDEVFDLLALRKGLGLDPAEYRGLHGRAFASVLAQVLEDKAIDEKEAATLRRLHQCLSRLGYAPGE